MRERTGFEGNLCRYETWYLVRHGYLRPVGWVEGERGLADTYLPTGKKIRVLRAKKFWR